ncbi:MAG TPA: hypothetical protein VIV09_18085 [Pseudolabrys sp.]
MLTKKDFRLPDAPGLTGNASQDVVILKKAVDDLKKGVLDILRGLNDPNVLTLTKAQLDTSAVGLNDPSTGAFTTLSATGLVDLSGAAAGQIKFPATPNASADANTLDDYEEGTWTPVLTFSTPGDLSITYSVQYGSYTKVGRIVVVEFAIVTSAFTFTTASGICGISGLPFAASSDSGYQAIGTLVWGGITKASYTSVQPAILAASSAMNLDALGSGQTPAIVAAADMPTGGTIRLRGTVTYHI